jgi:hypothetical protein
MRKDEIEGAAYAIKLLETPDKGNPFVGLPPYMDLTTADWSAVNGKDDLEKYNKTAKGGKKDDSMLSDLLKKTKGNGGSGIGGGIGGGMGGGRGGGIGSGGGRTLPLPGAKPSRA